MPNVVDVSQTAQLFSTFVDNPVVVCFVGAIFLAYLLVVVWARRKDIQDLAKVGGGGGYELTHSYTAYSYCVLSNDYLGSTEGHIVSFCFFIS